MRLVLIALALLGCAELAVMALAAPPPGADPNSPIYKWFDRQHNVMSQSCCSNGDGHTLDDNQWRIAGTDYEVEIEGHWLRIAKPQYVRDGMTDPNPTLHAVVWYTADTTQPFGIRVWCFAPGWSS